MFEKNKTIDQWNDTELKKLLAWYQVPAKETKTITDRRAKWKDIMERQLKEPPFQIWREEDEMELQRLKTNEVDLRETQLGRTKEITKSEFTANFKVMDKEERKDMLEKLKTIDDEITDFAGV